jgi:hypothetical protein
MERIGHPLRLTSLGLSCPAAATDAVFSRRRRKQGHTFNRIRARPGPGCDRRRDRRTSRAL